jgi:flagellar basal body rod protein FlgB
MDITTEAVRVGLAIAKTRMQIASSNIAHANMPGTSMHRADFAHVLSMLEEVVRSPSTASAYRLAQIDQDSLQGSIEKLGPASDNTASLDDQVAELNIDSTRFKALTEGLTRRFALMQLAISGS